MRQRVGRQQHRRQLALEQPPGQHRGKERQHDRRNQHALFHLANRGKRLVGRQIPGNEPTRHWNLPGRRENLDAERIERNAKPLETTDKAIEQRIDAERNHFHDAPFVRGRGDHPLLRHHQQIAAGPAIVILRGLIKEVWLTHVDHAYQRADDPAISGTQRNRHHDHGNAGRPPHDRRADGHPPFVEHVPEIVPIQVTHPHAPGRERNGRNGHAGSVGDERATVELAEQVFPAFEMRLDCRRPVSHHCLRLTRHLAKPIDPVLELMIEPIRYQ